MKRARLVVLASGRGSNYSALAEAIAAGQCHAEIVGVVSDKQDAGVLARATEGGVPTHVEPLGKGADRAAWNERLRDAVAAFAPDFVVLAGFMRVVAPSFLDRFRHRVVNVHPSLLPAFPGHDGPAQAIRAGVRITGCTVHLVDDGVDTGPILAQAAVPVLPDDDVASLHGRIQRVEHALLAASIDALARGEFSVSDPRTTTARFDAAASLVVPSITTLRT